MNWAIGTGKKKTLVEKYGPLKKVVREFVIFERVHMLEMPRYREELECGHIIPQKRDIYGYTNATRRRCWKCGNAP